MFPSVVTLVTDLHLKVSSTPPIMFTKVTLFTEYGHQSNQDFHRIHL